MLFQVASSDISESYTTSPVPQGPLGALGTARAFLSSQVQRTSQARFDTSVELPSPVQRETENLGRYDQQGVKHDDNRLISGLDTKGRQHKVSEDAEHPGGRKSSGLEGDSGRYSGNEGQLSELTEMGRLDGRKPPQADMGKTTLTQPMELPENRDYQLRENWSSTQAGKLDENQNVNGRRSGSRGVDSASRDVNDNSQNSVVQLSGNQTTLTQGGFAGKEIRC